MSNLSIEKSERRFKQKLFIYGALVGASVFLLIFGLKSLVVTDDSWILGGYIEQDILQHYLGWMSYRASPLALPLCITTQFYSPVGISIAYTDSIPLFAIIFRLLEPLLPDTFQYFGIFMLLCFILQGSCAALLLSLFMKGSLRPLVGSALFAVSPVLLERAFRHTALSAQFLILAALYMYFSARRKNRLLSLWFAALAALAVTIHAYFVPLLFAIAFASLLEYAVKHKTLLRPLSLLIASFAAVLASAWAVGLFHSKSSQTIGYGYFCMNLNSLFNPTSQGIDSWSALLPRWGQGLGTYEGFNYLGLGVLVICVCAAVYSVVNLRNLNFRARVKSHFGLVFVCICLSVFAISNVVVLNSFTLFEIGIPRSLIDICSNLRASGRMFWVPYYLIMLACVLFVVRRVKPRWMLASLCALVVVQTVDMTPALLQKHNYLYSETPMYSSPFTSEFWKIAARNYDRIFTIDSRGIHEPLFMAHIAVENGMTSNDPFAARSDLALLDDEIEAEMDKARKGDIDPKTLYITTYESTFLRYADFFLGKALCARVDMYWYVLAPYNADLLSSAFPGADVFIYNSLPFTVADHTDEQWSGGVFNSDPKTICFYDNIQNRKSLTGASALVLGEERYNIKSANYLDKGWIILKLDRSGEALRGVELDVE
ncbi:MAG: DUF6311 domain-containing protein [Oscillospiraceae bacterium]